MMWRPPTNRNIISKIIEGAACIKEYSVHGLRLLFEKENNTVKDLIANFTTDHPFHGLLLFQVTQLPWSRFG